MFNETGTYFPNGINVPAGKLFIDGETAQATAVADVAAANGVAAVGTEPTKAEFDAVVTLANENKAKLNALLAALRASGMLDS